MRGFKGLVLTEKIGESPAAVHLRSGVLHINPKVFFSYPPEWQKFILLHELGHYLLQTRSELEADNFAFHHFAKEGNSLKEAVNSLLRVLNLGIKSHRERVEAQLERAKYWDEVIYNKQFKTAKERVKAMSDYIQSENSGLAHCLGSNDYQGAKEHMVNILLVCNPEGVEKLLDKFATLLAEVKMGHYDGHPKSDLQYFFCFGNKACQARNKAKADARAELIKSRATAKTNRSEAKIIKAEAEQTLAEQGIKKESGAAQVVNDLVKGVSNVAGSIFGGNAPQPIDNITTIDNPPPIAPVVENNKGAKTGLYVGITVVTLIVIGVAMYFFLRKKK